jgi:hypothetical protein
MDEFGPEHLALEVGKLPRLMLIDARAIILHEESDERRGSAILARIETDGLVRHPLMAARDPRDGYHLLLDGVNRYASLRKLGCQFVPIQEVNLDDPGVGLTTWHHELEGLSSEEVVNTLSSSMRVVAFDGGFTPSGDFIPRFESNWGCVVVLPDRRCIAVIVEGTTQQRVEGIRRVVRRLSPEGAMDRVSYTNLGDLVSNYPRFSALVCYPSFTKSNILHMASTGVLFPSGVTRFSVPKRVLSFGFPLSLLRSQEGIADAQQALEAMIVEKIRQRRIRFYEEPTFHFDD